MGVRTAIRPCGLQVLPHADLLAVVQRGSAGQREQQAVDHPEPPRVAVEHGWQPALEAAAVELHGGVGPERREDLLALHVRQLVEGELVVVAHERRPLAAGVELGRLRSALVKGRESPRASDR